MAEEKQMRPIWYFVGLILLSMGLIVFISGIYYLFSPTRAQTVLAELHPDIWWGGIMILAGVVFLLANRNSGRTRV